MACRHGILPQQLNAWRRADRGGCPVLPWDDGPGFVPVAVDDAQAPAFPRLPGAAEPAGMLAGVIEIEVANVGMRLPAQTEPERITAVVAAPTSSA